MKKKAAEVICGVHVGGASADGLREAQAGILAILGSGQDQATIQMALETLTKVVKAPESVSLEGCHVTVPYSGSGSV